MQFSTAEKPQLPSLSDRFRRASYFYKQLKPELGRPKVAQSQADCKKRDDLV